MIRFLILGIIIISIYLGFSYLMFLNDPILILFKDYQIEFSVLVGILSFLLIQFVFVISMKLIGTVVCFPHTIKNYFKNRSIKKIELQMSLIIENYLLGFKQKALDMSKEIYGKLSDREKRIADIIIADASDNIEEKLSFYQNFLAHKALAPYANKKLAQIFLQDKNYYLAEKHATEYFDSDENDQENILTLMNVYYAAGERQKLLLLVSKIENLESEFWQKNSDQVVTYLYKLAKDLVVFGEEEEAKKYLEYNFKIKPDHLETLVLYSEISVNNNSLSQLLVIAKAAFNYLPSFDIAKIYADNASHKSAEEIYNDLAASASPQQYQGVFLAIAAYLGLDDKIQKLK